MLSICWMYTSVACKFCISYKMNIITLSVFEWSWLEHSTYIPPVTSGKHHPDNETMTIVAFAKFVIVIGRKCQGTRSVNI